MKINPHLFTPYEYAEAFEKSLLATKSIRFVDLVPGQLYYYRESAAGYLSTVRNRKIVRVGRMTPSKRKATLAFGPEFSPQECYATSLMGEFHPVTEELIQHAWTPHRCFVEQAVAAKQAVPAKVRRYYPDLFVTIPESVDKDELVTLLTGWGKITNAEDIAKCVESTHESIRSHDNRAAMWITRGHSTQEEHDKARNSLLDKLALYTWLAPLVAPGGVFAVE